MLGFTARVQDTSFFLPQATSTRSPQPGPGSITYAALSLAPTWERTTEAVFSPGLLSCCPACPPPPPPWMPGPCPLQQPSSPHLSQRRSSHCSLLWSVMSATTAAWQGGPIGGPLARLPQSSLIQQRQPRNLPSPAARSGGEAAGKCCAAPRRTTACPRPTLPPGLCLCYLCLCHALKFPAICLIALLLSPSIASPTRAAAATVTASADVLAREHTTFFPTAAYWAVLRAPLLYCLELPLYRLGGRLRNR